MGSQHPELPLRDHYWHLLCHRSELPSPGDFLRLEWFGEEVVVSNDQGNLIVFDNLCPHRGARFFLEDSGNAPIVCKYHGWSFRKGTLHVARRERFDPCELEGAGLHRHETAWCGDFLFASPKPPQPLAEQLGETYPMLEQIGRTLAGRVDWNRGVYPCDWKIAVENALEPYHIPLIHRESLGQLGLEQGTNTFYGLSSLWRAPVGNARMRKQLGVIRRFFALDFAYEGYASFYLFPFTMLSSTGGYSYSLQHFLPSARPYETGFSSRLLVSTLAEGVAKETLETFFASTAAMNRQVFDEDREICGRVAQRDDYMQRFATLSHEEEKIRHFRRTYREALSLGE